MPVELGHYKAGIEADWKCRKLRGQQEWWRCDAHAAGRQIVRIGACQFYPGMTLAIDQRKAEGLSRSTDRTNAK